MDADEKCILEYLKTWGTQFVSAKEICRRADTKRRFNNEPDWARIVLIRMADRRIVESDASGRYRIKPGHKKEGNERWISPEIQKILAENAVNLDGLEDELKTGEH